MENFGGAIGNASFGEPASADTTSTPTIPDSPQAPPQQASPLALAIAKAKKKSQIKKPATLSAAIAKARAARQGGHKYGS